MDGLSGLIAKNPSPTEHMYSICESIGEARTAYTQGGWGCLASPFQCRPYPASSLCVHRCANPDPLIELYWQRGSILCGCAI